MLDRGQFRPVRGWHVAGHHHLGTESSAFQPVHGLPGGPHGPAFKGEALRLDGRLVTVV